jgi:hypothetical protein
MSIGSSVLGKSSIGSWVYETIPRRQNPVKIMNTKTGLLIINPIISALFLVIMSEGHKKGDRLLFT